MLKYFFVLFCACYMIPAYVCGQGIITTIAGNGITQYIGDGSPATSYSLAEPKGICVDGSGKVYVAEFADSRVATVYLNTLNTIAGGGAAGDTGDGGAATAAELRNPDGVCLDTAGNLYITEWYSGLIRKIDAHTGIISTICGTTNGYGGDGGPATAAMLASPGASCVDRVGNIYIADFNNQRVRKIDVTTGDISTIAGTGVSGYSGDDGPATGAKLSYPSGVSVDGADNVYFSEYGNNTIRRIDAATGIITTVAGTGTQGYSGDAGLAIHAKLGEPNGLYVDKNDYIYISDFANNVIRLVTPAGIIYTAAGTGAHGYTGDGGPPKSATFNGPMGVCTDDSGYVYVADGYNSVIRKISPIDTLNLGARTMKQTSFDVYPNPSNGVFTIMAATQGSGEIQVMNMVGQCVYNQRSTQNRTEINLVGYAPGVYFVKYTTLYGNATQRIVIE